MIALDNGPADGDYVRYIETLIAATRTTATGTGTGAVISSPTFVPMPSMTAPGQAPTTRSSPVVAGAVARAGAATPQVPGNAATTRGFAAVAIGLVLLAAGFLSEPVRGILVLLGIFAIGSGARTLMRATGARLVAGR